MLRRWLALTYHLYALQLAALYHFYFNPLYFPSEVLDYAASRPDQAAAYTAALLILLQSAIMHRRHSTELGLCRDRYRRENIGCRLPETMRQALDEAFAAAEVQGVLA